MKRIAFFTGVLLFLWINNNAQKLSSHGDINSGNTVTNVFHPQLAYPENQSTIVVSNPVFIWLPPPNTGNLMVVYSIRLVKVENGQTSQQALIQNMPLVNLSGLSNTFLSYPADAPALENNAQYAWHVSASSAGKSLGEADINTFSVQMVENNPKNLQRPELIPMKKPPLNKQKSDSNTTTQQKQKTSQTANVAQKTSNSAVIFDVYPVASVVSDGHFYVTNGMLKFAYINKANDKKLTYVIKRLDKNKNLTSLPELDISSGTNKLAINLQHNAEMEQGKYYDLEITDSKGQVYKLLYYYVTQ